MNDTTKKLSREAKIGIVIAFISIVFFTTMLIIRNVGTVKRPTSTGFSSSTTTSVGPSSNVPASSEAPVADLLEEKMLKPFSVEATIYRYFYDADTPDTNEKALINFQGGVVQSLGVDYVHNDEYFSVYSAFSGVVNKVEIDDPIYGTTVYIRSSDGLVSCYQSLSTTNLVKDQVINRGDLIGRAGRSIYRSDAKVHLHFAIFRDDKPINPEKFYNFAVKDIK